MSEQTIRERVRSLVEASSETRAAMAKLAEDFELGEVTFADHQRGLESGAIAIDEIWRALVELESHVKGEPVQQAFAGDIASFAMGD